MQRLGIREFLKSAENGRIVDVRSPGEYLKGHIPGAVNIPIFTNKERAEVGTVYKQQSREEAIMLGLDIVGPKLRKIADEGKSKAIDNKLHIYCWRGGMRSEKMAWLFELNGLATRVLEGGYKSYRGYGKELIDQIQEFIVIQGPTGSGKTEIINSLRKKGEQVIDLEGLANHKGSAFGGLGMKAQPTTQQFQNDIYSLLQSFDPQKPVWLESESATIGKVYLPEALWQRMNRAMIVSLRVPIAHRIDNIIRQYGLFTAHELNAKVAQLSQKLGGAKVKEVSQYINDGNLVNAVQNLLLYYDESYAYSASQHKSGHALSVEVPSINPDNNAEILLKEVKKNLVNEI